MSFYEQEKEEHYCLLNNFLINYIFFEKKKVINYIYTRKITWNLDSSIIVYIFHCQLGIWSQSLSLWCPLWSCIYIHINMNWHAAFLDWTFSLCVFVSAVLFSFFQWSWVFIKKEEARMKDQLWSTSPYIYTNFSLFIKQKRKTKKRTSLSLLFW